MSTMKTPTIKTPMIKTIAAALALTAAIAAPAMSAQAAGRAEVKVHYSDLNLATEEGRAVFNRRIERAAVKLCGRVDGRTAIDRTIAKCQSDTLTAANASRDVAIADYSSKRLAKAGKKVIRLVAQ